ncbi:MAG TPA: phosphatase PAP2 family protein [Polyangia bacterium]|nr:phosphatase PAP2 family protein [Polyangia bacterium]
MPRRSALCLFIVLAQLGAGVARADDAPAQDPNAPRIAAPSPEAPAADVEQAKAAAQKAAPTPIVPSPGNPRRPAFQLYAEIDLPVLAIGLVFAEARAFRAQTAYCAPLCDASTLNAVDRVTAGYWSPRWQSASDYGLYAIALGAGAVLLADEGLYPGLNDLVVVAESGLAATALASIMTLASSRPRPYMFGEKAPLGARNSPDGGLSFLSSHAAVSFAVATSTFMTLRRLHPNSRATWIAMVVGGGVAAFVATARVMGGMHFISDSVGGTVVGVSLGVLIPSLHRSPVAVVPVAGEVGQRGIAVAVRF